jgi:hypothetical protein
MAGLDDKWTIDKLDGSNWTTWKFQMKHLLMAKGLWGIVDGTETVPGAGQAAARAEFNKRSQKAQATIVLGISTTQLYLVTTCETAKDMWDVLKQHFERDSLANKIYLKKQYFRMEMKDGTSVEDHLKQMKELTDKLAAIGAPIGEEDQVVTLLGSLPASYAALVTALEARPGDLSLSYVQQALVHEELKRNGQSVGSASGSKGDAALVGAYNKRKGTTSFKKKIQCYNCKKFGHFKKNCPDPLKSESSSSGHKAKIVDADSASDGAFEATMGSSVQEHHWLVDSGASCHMTWEKELLGDFKKLDPPQKVGLGDGHVVDAVGTGKVRMTMDLGSKYLKSAVLYEVLYVPKLACNLFSVKAAAQRGNMINFGHTRCWINGPNGDLCGRGTVKGKLYHLDCEPVVRASVAKSDKTDLWHQRLGHVNGAQLKEMVQKGLVNGLDGISQAAQEFCEGCVKGKMNRKPFKPIGEIRSTRKLQLVHSDVCGPMQTESLGGHKYFVTFIDDYSRCCHVYFLKHKSEVPEKFKEFQALTENDAGKKIQILRSDRGGEYLSQDFEKYLKHQGIKHELSVARCPEQNGVAERMNRTLVESARAMLSHAGLPNIFWAEAVSTAAYLRNRIPTSAFKRKMTPYERWYSRKPNLDHLKVFGCVAYAHIPDEERKKLDMKAEKLRFVGYSIQCKGYRLYDEEKRQIKIRRDVIFNESNFNLKEGSTVRDETINIEEPILINNEEKQQPDDHRELPEEVEEPRRSNRDRRAPVKYGYDEFADSAGGEHQVHHVAYRVGQVKEPKTLKEAMESDHAVEWKAAADCEFRSLMENETWELMELPAGRKPISCKWVFKVKYGKDGLVDRFKGRLVARGFVQEYGVDYEETFSPVVKFSSIRTLLAFAVEKQMLVHQMDVITAFLNGRLEEEIYMEQPEGYVKPGTEHMVCKLKKSLYGLKQAPRCWNKEFRHTWRA